MKLRRSLMGLSLTGRAGRATAARRLVPVWLLGSLVLAAVGLAQQPALADGCVNPPVLSPQNGWQQGIGTVSVDISPAFSNDQVQAIEQAFTNWQNSGAGKAAGITFQFNQTFVGNLVPPGHFGVQSVPASSIGGDAGQTDQVGPGVSARTHASTELSNAITNDTGLEEVMAHEIGHTFGLDDCTTCIPAQSVMASGFDPNNPPATANTGPTGCDAATAIQNSGYPNPNPPPGGHGRPCLVDSNPCCTDPSDPECTPIILDVDGSGFHLTSAAHGVLFDFFGNHHPIRMAWIAPGSTNAFLVLPQHGKVTNGSELFGNLTPQPPSAHPNGFLALASYASLAGHAGATVIDRHDPVYFKLRLWQFSDHNGVLGRGTLSTLPQLGIKAIYLNYKVTHITDRYGNVFGYQARVISTSPHAAKYAYDISLQAAGTTGPPAAATRPSGGGNDAIAIGAMLAIAIALALVAGQRIRRRRSRPAELASTIISDMVPGADQQQPEPAARS